MFGVEADPEERYRAARGVESRIADELVVRGELQVRPANRQLQPVVGLQDLLVRVVEAAVSQEKAVPAGGEILAMPGREAFGDGGGADDIVGTIPVGAGELGAEACQLVDFRERKTFRLAVIPAETRKEAGRALIGERLLDVHSKTVLRAPVRIVGNDVGAAVVARG